MTSKERLEAALSFKTVDHIPFMVVDGGTWISAAHHISLKQMLDMEDAGAQLMLDFYRYTETDLPFVAAGIMGFFYQAIGCKIHFNSVGTPLEIEPFLANITEAPNLNKDNIRDLLYTDKNIQKILLQLDIIKKEIGSEKYLTAPYAAPFTIAGRLLGVQKLMEAIYDEEDELEALFNYSVSVCTELGSLLAEHGLDSVFLCDPVASGDLISQSMFEDYALGLEREAFSLINTKYHFLHICGNTLPRLESLKGINIDGFSLDSVDLRTAMEKADLQYAIIGNVSPSQILGHKSSDEIQEISSQLCSTAGRQGGFILAPGCDLPPCTPKEHILALKKGIPM